jgi:hypothetical protein
VQQQASLERESAKINRLRGQTVTAAGWAENLFKYVIHNFNNNIFCTQCIQSIAQILV